MPSPVEQSARPAPARQARGIPAKPPHIISFKATKARRARPVRCSRQPKHHNPPQLRNPRRPRKRRPLKNRRRPRNRRRPSTANPHSLRLKHRWSRVGPEECCVMLTGAGGPASARWRALGTSVVLKLTDPRALAHARRIVEAARSGDRPRVQPLPRRFGAGAPQCPRRRSGARWSPAAAGRGGGAARRAPDRRRRRPRARRGARDRRL